MTQEQFIELKDAYIDNIQKYFKEAGDLFAHVALFCEFKKDAEDYDERPAIVHVPIPSEMLKSDEGKDFFINSLLKDAVKDIKEKFIIIGVAWSAEAWMRVSDVKPKSQADIDNIPVNSEVIIINIESENVKECKIFEIERTNVSIEKDGSLKTGNINFKDLGIKQTTPGGRFSGLYDSIKD